MGSVRSSRLLGACALLLSLAAGAADWPFHRQNDRGDGNPGEALTTAQAQTFHQKWVFSDNGLNYANPIVVGSTVYVTSGDGNLYAIDVNTGKSRWARRSSIVGPFKCLPQSQSKGPIGAPAVVGSDVFMPGADGFVYDYDAATGNTKWRTQIADVLNKGEFLWTSSFPLHGKVYYGISALIDCLLPPGRVVALDQATGQVVGTWWGGGSSHQPGAGVWDQPAYDSRTNRMFLTTGTIASGLTQSQEPWSDAFVAIDPDTMQTVDSFAPIGTGFSADFDFGAGPTLYDTADGRHLIAATNKNGYVYALNRDSLASGVLWTYQISAPGASPDLGESSIVPAAYGNGLLFVGGGRTRDGFSGAVAALDGATGRAQWVFHPHGFLLAGIIATGDVVIFGTGVAGTFNGDLYVLDQRTGNVLFHQAMGAVFGAPTYANGVLYVPDLTGKLTAFVADGTGGGTPPPPPPPGPTSFSDNFNRSGALGGNWLLALGAFTDNGAAAVSGSAQSYAFWNGTPAPDAPVAADVAQNSATYVGVTARARSSGPVSDHYAAYIAPDGTTGLAHRIGGSYTYLAFGPKLAAGTHRLELTAFGANPVSLTVKVDGVAILHATDSSSSALTTTGYAGIFDYNGKGAPIDNFTVGTGAAPPPPPPPPGNSQLTVTLAGGGAGTVTSAPAGISCPGTCTASFTTGASVTLTASASGSSTFAGWSGACSGTGACTLTLSADTSVTATFGSTTPPGTQVIASDEFTTAGALGASGWKVWRGAFNVSGGAAHSASSRSYATKGNAVTGDVTVSATVVPGGNMSYFGVIARANPAEGSQSHYAAWANADGTLHLGRANNWSYTYLQDSTVKLTGAHKLTLKVQGTGPVEVTLFVDDQPILDVMDTSAQALTSAGTAGIFSWQGAGPSFEHFLATQP